MDQPDQLAMNWRSAVLALPMLASAMCLAHLYARDLERPAIGWLASLVLAVSLSVMPMIIGFANAYRIWPGLTFLPVNCELLFGPLLYFHARSLMIAPDPDTGKASRQMWLLAPFALHLVYQLWAFLALGNGVRDFRAKWDFNEAVHDPYIAPFVFALALVMTAISIAAVWRMRQRYTAWLAQNRSDDERFDATWIANFVRLAVPAALVWGATTLAAPVLNWQYVDTFWADFIVQLLILTMCVEALARIQAPFPKMPNELQEDEEPELDEPAETRDWQAEGMRIGSAIEGGGWFLEPSLSLQDVARRCATNQAYVSRALNQGRAQSFSHFVNGLRVNYAKRLIEQGEDSLIDIALQAGFGSKASFNRAFLLHAGMAPSAWRDAEELQRLNS